MRLNLCQYLERNEDEDVTMNHLSDKLNELLPAGELPYSKVYIKQKLREHYGDRIQQRRYHGRYSQMYEASHKIVRQHFSQMSGDND